MKYTLYTEYTITIDTLVLKLRFSVLGDSQGRWKAIFVLDDPRRDRGGRHKRPRSRIRAKVLHRSDPSITIYRQTTVPGKLPPPELS